MHLKGWYLKLLIAWAVLAVPGFILGWAYAGHAPWNDLHLIFNPPRVSVVVPLLVWAFMLSPFALAPFGITRKAHR